MGLARLRQMNDEPTRTDGQRRDAWHVRLHLARAGSRPADRRRRAATSTRWAARCSTCWPARPPFPEGTVLQKLLQHQSDRPPDLRSFRSDVPDSVSRVVRRMLAKAPADRHQTPIDLIADLAEILEELDTPLPFAATTLPWTMPPRTVPRWRKHCALVRPVGGADSVRLCRRSADENGRRRGVLPSLDASPVADSATPNAIIPATESSTSSPSANSLPPLIAPAPLAVAPVLQETVLSEPVTGATTSETATSLAATEPTPTFSLDEPWEMSKSLWDIVSNWPTTPDKSSTLGPRRTPLGNKSETSIFPSPSISINLRSLIEFK